MKWANGLSTDNKSYEWMNEWTALYGNRTACAGEYEAGDLIRTLHADGLMFFLSLMHIAYN